MIRTSLTKERSVPWWVVLLAPLIGVPVMVALLTLAAPDRPAPAGELDTGVATEHMEQRPADRSLERRAEHREPLYEPC